MSTHRIRRGKLVPIPPEWQGKTVGRQTLAKRRQNQELRKKLPNPKYREVTTVEESLTGDEVRARHGKNQYPIR